jgi:hypothetical protein
VLFAVVLEKKKKKITKMIFSVSHVALLQARLMSVSLLAAVFVSASLLWQGASSQGQAALTFTGNVEDDFWGKRGVVTTFDGIVDNGTVGRDVGVPTVIPRTSGWDIKTIDMLYDFRNNALHIGINCFGVCGDADGDGNASFTSPELDGLGGKDLPDFIGTESFAVAIDFGDEFGGPINGQFDFIIGYPGGNAANNVLSCTQGKTNETLFSSIDCFGLYVAAESLGTNLGSAFVEPPVLPGVQGVLPHRATDHNPRPNMARPDLEWTIEDLSQPALKGEPAGG